MVILIIIICMFFVCQGLILSKALKAQKDAEDESTRIAFGNLCSEVITLQNEALEKAKEARNVRVAEREMCPWAISKYFGD